MMKKVSVVMCTYNGESFLKEQIDSILNQTYPIHELIIQDDCSTDSTVLIIEEYVKKYSFIHFHQNVEQQGVNKNFYSAMSKVTGEYIAISDQDDIWEVCKIEKQMEYIGDNLLCFCFSKPFVQGKTSIAFDERIPNYSPERMIFVSVIPGHTILMNSVLIKKISSLISFNCFMYDATLQITASLEQKITFCPEVLVHQRRHVNAATYTAPLNYSKTPVNMVRSIVRTLKLYAEIKPEMRRIFKERYCFIKAIPVEAYKKRDIELLALHMHKKGVINYLKLTFLCLKLKDRLFYTKEKNYLLSILRGAFFPVSCTDYFRYLSSMINIKAQ